MKSAGTAASKTREVKVKNAAQVKFINPNSGPLPPPSYLLQFLKSIWVIALLFGLVVLIAAVAYFIGSQFGWGIQPTYLSDSEKVNAPDIKFVDCLYFSVVTITTTGFGDFRPVSFSRGIAGSEAIIGIVLAGIFVSKLVSQQQERLALRLVKGQLNAEVQSFRKQMLPLLERPTYLLPALVLNRRSEWLHLAAGLHSSIARYWRYQANEPDLGVTMPLKASGRLLDHMATILERVVELSANETRDSLHFEDRNAIRKLTESSLLAAKVLCHVSNDKGLMHTKMRIDELVTPLRRRLKLHIP